MAENWIKWRKNLKEDPRVMAIARALGVSRLEVLGALSVWFCYTDEHTADGTLPMVDYELIDSPEIVGLSGFANQLERVHWIEPLGEGCRVVNFDDHMGESAKRRAQKSSRQRRWREGDVDARASTREEESREEKRREKKAAAARVTWSESGGFVIPDKIREALAKAAPDVNLDRDIAQAHAWLLSNPEKRPVSRYGRFLTGWVKRTQKDIDDKPKPHNIRDKDGTFDWSALEGKK